MPTRIYKKRFFILIAILSLAALPVRAEIVNINTANSEGLQTLPGIGPTYAQRIIDYRSANGPFGTKEEIKNVKGIGDATYAKMEDSITVGDIAATEGDDEAKEDLEPASSTSFGDTSQDSAHYSSVPLATAKPSLSIVLGAGRDRIGATGSPMEFRAETDSLVAKRDSFLWNFGDGNVASGEVVSHAYEFPGDYVVVLDATLSDKKGIARADVRIVDPELVILEANPEVIVVENKADQEVSLFGRAIVSGGDMFIIPKDTIIKSGAKISFSAKATGLHPVGESAVGFMVLGEESDTLETKEELERYKTEQVSYIQEKITALEKQMAGLQISSQPEASADAEVEQETMKGNTAGAETASAVVSLPESGSESETGWFDIVKMFFLRK